MAANPKTPGVLARIAAATTPDDALRIAGEANAKLQNAKVLFRINRMVAKRIKELARP